jgi:hypothetical protein
MEAQNASGFRLQSHGPPLQVSFRIWFECVLCWHNISGWWSFGGVSTEGLNHLKRLSQGTWSVPQKHPSPEIRCWNSGRPESLGFKNTSIVSRMCCAYSPRVFLPSSSSALLRMILVNSSLYKKPAACILAIHHHSCRISEWWWPPVEEKVINIIAALRKVGK